MLTWVAIALAAYAAAVLALMAAGRRTQARALAGFIPDCVILLKRLLADPRVPRRRRVLMALALGYLLVPFDLVPDFVPVAGQLDDAIVVGLALRGLLTEELAREHWPGPEPSLRVLLRLSARPARRRT